MINIYDDLNAITQPTIKVEGRDCECGAWTTYGRDISDFCHEEYCPRKKMYVERPDFSHYRRP